MTNPKSSRDRAQARRLRAAELGIDIAAPVELEVTNDRAGSSAYTRQIEYTKQSFLRFAQGQIDAGKNIFPGSPATAEAIMSPTSTGIDFGSIVGWLIWAVQGSRVGLGLPTIYSEFRRFRVAWQLATTTPLDSALSRSVRAWLRKQYDAQPCRLDPDSTDEPAVITIKASDGPDDIEWHDESLVQDTCRTYLDIRHSMQDMYRRLQMALWNPMMWHPSLRKSSIMRPYHECDDHRPLLWEDPTLRVVRSDVGDNTLELHFVAPNGKTQEGKDNLVMYHENKELWKDVPLLFLIYADKCDKFPVGHTFDSLVDPSLFNDTNRSSFDVKFPGGKQPVFLMKSDYAHSKADYKKWGNKLIMTSTTPSVELGRASDYLGVDSRMRAHLLRRSGSLDMKMRGKSIAQISTHLRHKFLSACFENYISMVQTLPLGDAMYGVETDMQEQQSIHPGKKSKNEVLVKSLTPEATKEIASNPHFLAVCVEYNDYYNHALEKYGRKPDFPKDVEGRRRTLHGRVLLTWNELAADAQRVLANSTGIIVPTAPADTVVVDVSRFPTDEETSGEIEGALDFLTNNDFVDRPAAAERAVEDGVLDHQQLDAIDAACTQACRSDAASRPASAPSGGLGLGSNVAAGIDLSTLDPALHPPVDEDENIDAGDGQVDARASQHADDDPLGLYDGDMDDGTDQSCTLAQYQDAVAYLHDRPADRRACFEAWKRVPMVESLLTAYRKSHAPFYDSVLDKYSCPFCSEDLRDLCQTIGAKGQPLKPSVIHANFRLHIHAEGLQLAQENTYTWLLDNGYLAPIDRDILENSDKPKGKYPCTMKQYTDRVRKIVKRDWGNGVATCCKTCPDKPMLQSVADASQHLFLHHGRVLPGSTNTPLDAASCGVEPLYFVSQAQYFVLPGDILNVCQQIYDERIVQPSNGITSYGIQPDIEHDLPHLLDQKDKRGKSIDTKLERTQGASSLAIKEGFSFFRVHDPRLGWAERMRPFDGSYGAFDQAVINDLILAIRTLRQLLDDFDKGYTIHPTAHFMFDSQTGRMRCPDPVCVRGNRQFSSILRLIAHIVAVHRVHFNGPRPEFIRRSKITLSELAFTDEAEMQEFFTRKRDPGSKVRVNYPVIQHDKPKRDRRGQKRNYIPKKDREAKEALAEDGEEEDSQEEDTGDGPSSYRDLNDSADIEGNIDPALAGDRATPRRRNVQDESYLDDDVDMDAAIDTLGNDEGQLDAAEVPVFKRSKAGRKAKTRVADLQRHAPRRAPGWDVNLASNVEVGAGPSTGVAAGESGSSSTGSSRAGPITRRRGR